MSNVERKLFVEPERYEFTAASIHQFDLARRDFFKILGAGIAVFAIAKMLRARRRRRPVTAVFTTKNCPRTLARGCTSAKTAA